jgi:hypothetical protein
MKAPKARESLQKHAKAWESTKVLDDLTIKCLDKYQMFWKTLHFFRLALQKSVVFFRDGGRGVVFVKAILWTSCCC